ncbi:MAG TPA: hypothetical protein VIF43_01020 [Patescibacteria group bacterium]|jgi:hypothetical protein
MPAEGHRSPDSDDPSSGERVTLAVEAGPDGEMPEEPVASIFDRNIVRRLTIAPQDGPLISALRLAGRARRRPEPLPDPRMIDLMDRPIPTIEEGAAEAADEAPADGDAIAPPEDGEEIVVSIERSEPRRTPPPTPDEVPGALPA